MDNVDALLSTLCAELETHKGLALEAHLYGCLSLWEQWSEGVMEIEGGVVKEEGEEPLNLSSAEDWERLGEVFGFTDTVPPYTGSEAYRSAWLSVFLNPLEWRNIGRVDAVEGPLFEKLEALGVVYMLAALPTGELPTGWTPPLTEREGVHKIQQQNGRRKYKHTRRTHGRRSLTPVHRDRHFSKTRRATKALSV
jgi:hypothetical protein